MIHNRFKTWVDQHLKRELEAKGYAIQYVSAKESDFGALEGIQIETKERGGHIYFWSSGFYNFHFYDFVKDDNLIADTHGNYAGQEFEVLLKNLLACI